MVPKIGVHRGIAMRAYHGWSAVSNSRLARFKRSPAHLMAYLEEPPPDTRALVEGRAVHMAVLEPDKFAQFYVEGPRGDRRTKAIKEAWNELEDEYGPGYVLKPDQWNMCMAIRDSIHKRKSARALLAGDGDCELSIAWQEPETGLRCKARYDRLSPKLDGGTIVDLKTTTDASLRAFERSIFNFGYHRQGAFYMDGGAELEIPLHHYTIIAVEKSPPWEAGIYRMSEGALDGGRMELKPLLSRYQECMRTQHWPGYPDRVVDISLPPWAWSRIEEESYA